MKHLFAQNALAQIPKILTLLDRNVHSATYGCFDRNFWHYKIIDFPSGMAQEFVWPLALAYSRDLEGNPYYQQPAIKEWIEAGILYAARAAHADGSCDDYFPYEKAAGAAAFSLLACMESYHLLGLDNAEMRAFFTLRANWLASHHESGRLSNHAALIVLCLELAGRLLGTKEWEPLRDSRLATVLSWQNEEGWFQEYEGADPGYHTLTIGLLAQIYDLTGNAAVHAALGKAIGFATEFVHQDGSFGGEYTSRNTYNFFPHGFEIAGKWFPEALSINDRFLTGLQGGLAPCYADDHIIGHHTWSYLLAYTHFQPQRPALPPRKEGRVHFPNAGILIDRREGAELYLALNKGGVFKFFRDGKLVVSDTHVSLQVQEKKVKTAVAHLVGSYETELGESALTIAGSMGWAKNKGMTTFNLMVLRLIMICGGRLQPDLVRKLLQKLLITGKSSAPFQFRRTLHWEPGGRLRVADEVHSDRWKAVLAAGIGASQTSIYVVMSRTYQPGQMQPWLDLTSQVKTLEAGVPLRIERCF